MNTLWLALVLTLGADDRATPGKAAFEEASRLFHEGAYEEALPYFKTAYLLSEQRPSTVFGLAQCERALGQLEAAAFHLEEFIRLAPKQEAERAREILSTIREQWSAASSETQPPEPPRAVIHPLQSPPLPDPVLEPSIDKNFPEDPSLTPPPPPTEGKSFWTHPATWIVAGAIAIAGGVTAGLLLSQNADLQGGTSGVVFKP